MTVNDNIPNVPELSGNVPSLSSNVPELSSKQYDIGMTVHDNIPSLSINVPELSSEQYNICWDVNDDPFSVPSLSSEEEIDNRILKEDRKQNKKDNRLSISKIDNISELSSKQDNIGMGINDDPSTFKEDRKQNKKGMAPKHKLLILGIFSIVGVLIWGLIDM